MSTHAAKKIKILFLYPNEFLGPEMMVYAQILRHLDRARFTPYLVLNSDAEGTLPSGATDGVIIRRWKFGVAFRNGLGPALATGAGLPLNLLAVARYARREGISIVHTAATPRTGVMGLVVARGSGARLLLHYHVIPGRYAGPRGVAEAGIARRADRWVAVSQFMAERLTRFGIPPDRIDVVTNGTDTGRFHPTVDGSAIRREFGIAPDAPLVLQVARLIQMKRQEDLVRAFALARREVPTLRGLIVGWEDPRYDGPFPGYKAELQHLCREGGLGDSLILADARPDTPHLVAAADIVAMPALEDSWNLAVTEALAGGRPVIGAASGGIPEQVVHGVNGFLVPPRDPAAIARYLVTLAQDATLRGQLGRAARLRAETHFDERHVAADFAPIYEALVAGPRPVPGALPAQRRA